MKRGKMLLPAEVVPLSVLKRRLLDSRHSGRMAAAKKRDAFSRLWCLLTKRIPNDSYSGPATTKNDGITRIRGCQSANWVLCSRFSKVRFLSRHNSINEDTGCLQPGLNPFSRIGVPMTEACGRGSESATGEPTIPLCSGLTSILADNA